MRKKGLLMVVALLAVSCLMAAAAYSSATVTNAASLTVTNTDDSLMALTADHIGREIGFKDTTAEIENGILKFNFNKGRYADDNDEYGLQTNSIYTWWDEDNNRGLFQVKNNSNDTIKLSIAQDHNNYSGNLRFYYRMYNNENNYGSNDWDDLEGGIYKFNDSNEYLPPGGTAEIGVKIDIGAVPTGSIGTPDFFNIEITAEAVQVSD